MNSPFDRGEDSSFESGISIKKPIKTVSAAATQQAKQFTDDIVEQLYGKSDNSGQKSSLNDSSNQQNPPPPPSQKPQKVVHKLSGNSNVGDHAKYIARQTYLDKGDVKGAENVMHHMQYYFDPNIMTLEDRVKKNRQEQAQKAQQKIQQEDEETQQKKQEERKKQENPAIATGKGRNRMGLPQGKKPKTPMNVRMGKNKAEMFRGTSG